MIGMIKAVLVTVAIIVSINRIWVLPESQRERCIKAVHSRHIARIHKIDNLAVDGKIKSEMVEFSYIKEAEELESVCGVSDEKMVSK